MDFQGAFCTVRRVRAYPKEHRPDLVLLDLMLPGLSGEQVLPLIRGIPVIVVSQGAFCTVRRVRAYPLQQNSFC